MGFNSGVVKYKYDTKLVIADLDWKKVNLNGIQFMYKVKGQMVMCNKLKKTIEKLLISDIGL